MAFSPRLSLLLLLAALALVKAQEPTILSYLVQYEEEERQDFLELTVSTKAFSVSLHEAIAEAKQKAQKIKDLEESICRSLAKDKSECKESAQIGNVQIQPKYQTNKKVTTFEGITATYQILIKVNNPQYFGQLVDRILTFEGFVIDKIEWQPDEVPLLLSKDLIENTFLADSLEKSKEMCQELGLSLNRLVSVEEIREEPEEPEEEEEPAEEGEEQEEEQEEEEEEPEEESEATVYRITVECVKKQAKPAKEKQAAKKK